MTKFSSWSFGLLCGALLIYGCSLVSDAQGAGAEVQPREIASSIMYFRHKGNDCYIVYGVGVSCVENN